jgi:hypothetical protein
LLDRLAGVDSDADAHRQLSVGGAARERALDVDGTADCLASTGERDHEAVALRLDLVAAVLVGLCADDRVVGAEHFEPVLIAKPLV